MNMMIGEAPTLSVSEFVAVFNQSLEMLYPSVGVVGELANFRVSKGRWLYFDLKDEISSVRFFGTVYALPGPLEDGLTLEVHGRPRLHPQFGFSIQVDSIQAVGEGSIKKAQDLLTRKLEAEGLFEPSRKRTLPYPPETIGLVTSGQSAAIADFRKILDERWGKLHMQLIDVQVQGADAPAQIVNAIASFNQASVPPEVIVVIRGGGSADDLAAFSNEAVVRAVAGSRIPTLVAIGHEVDVSLAELAADQRASTPSNAAELLVPDRVHELRSLEAATQQLDILLSGAYRHAKEDVAGTKEQLVHLLQNLQGSARQFVESRKELLALLDPYAPLRRGYALVQTADGRSVRSVANLQPNTALNVRLTDGMIKTVIESIRVEN
jgi:exodeoxyribonuclease VII large subunit